MTPIEMEPYDQIMLHKKKEGYVLTIHHRKTGEYTIEGHQDLESALKSFHHHVQERF